MGTGKLAENKSKTILKVFFPVTTGLLILFLFDRIDSTLSPPDDAAAIRSIGFFDEILLPIIIAPLLLVQWLIILPIWNKVVLTSRQVFLLSMIVVTGISILIGTLLGYVIWAKQFGLRDLLLSIFIMSGVCFTYSFGNMVVLYLLDKSQISRLKSQISP